MGLQTSCPAVLQSVLAIVRLERQQYHAQNSAPRPRANFVIIRHTHTHTHTHTQVTGHIRNYITSQATSTCCAHGNATPSLGSVTPIGSCLFLPVPRCKDGRASLGLHSVDNFQWCPRRLVVTECFSCICLDQMRMSIRAV